MPVTSGVDGKFAQRVDSHKPAPFVIINMDGQFVQVMADDHRS